MSMFETDNPLLKLRLWEYDVLWKYWLLWILLCIVWVCIIIRKIDKGK